IQQENCSSIIEVMHGIGSIMAEQFFSAVIGLGRPFGAERKHFFVPQIPDLPLYGVLKRQLKFNVGLAINAYLNRYFIERFDAHSYDAIESRYRSLCGSHLAQEGRTILTIFGGCDSFLVRHVDTPSFSVECWLISMISH